MNGTFVADVLQSLDDGDMRQQHRQRARELWRSRFRCESLPPLVESLRATVDRTYPTWFTAELFDSSLAFKPGA